MEGWPPVTKAMNQDVVAFDAGNGLLNGDPYLADGTVVSLLRRGECWLRSALTLARFFVRHENLCPWIIRADAQVAQIDQHSECSKPVVVRGKLGFEHRIIMMMTAKSASHKEDDLGGGRNDRVLQRMLFFLPL